jgi:hypothetical protein
MLLLREQVLLHRAYRCPPPSSSRQRHLHTLQKPQQVSERKTKRIGDGRLETASTRNRALAAAHLRVHGIRSTQLMQKSKFARMRLSVHVLDLHARHLEEVLVFW